MTRTEHLLSILAEEGAEVAQRATKALRFGLTEAQPGQSESNAERILAEYYDLLAVLEMLQDAGALPRVAFEDATVAIMAKQAKVEHYLKYSAQCGTLDSVATADRTGSGNG